MTKSESNGDFELRGTFLACFPFYFILHGHDFNLSLFTHFYGRKKEMPRKDQARIGERRRNFMREMRNLIQRFHSHCYRVIDFQGHLIKIDGKMCTQELNG